MNVRRNIKSITFGVVALAAAVYFLPQYQQQLSRSIPTKNDALAEISHISSDSPLSIVTEPDDGITPVIETIHRARKSVELVTYDLEDSKIMQALVDAKNRGVAVRVLLDHGSHFGKKPNDAAYAFLQSQQVPVEWAKDYFPLTHQKTLAIDGVEALIMTFNFAPQYYQSSRDFAIVDTNPTDVAAIDRAFDSDWDGTEMLADNGDDLVWSPSSAQTLIALIDSASVSLDIYNEEMADARITQALERAAGRGVNVRVDMTYATQWKQSFQELAAAGVHIRTYASTAHLYIHAKVIIADGARAFVGSENFSRQSLDSNRELGILISRLDILSSIEKTFDNDWAGSRPFTVTELSPDSSSTAAAQSSPDPASATVIKLSSSGICHTPSDPSYPRTKNFKLYPTLQDCLAAGGHVPKS